MGKKTKQLPLHQHHQREEEEEEEHRCATCLNRIGREISFKCVVVFVIGLCVSLPTVFWLFPNYRTVGIVSKFDASEDIKLKATVQAIFRLSKPVSMLVRHIGKLEYDLYEEISVPFSKVVILSMHQAGTTNSTNVVFGILPDPIDSTINPVSLSLVRSCFIDLFLQQTNLSLTAALFGQPSSFEIVKFPGGITVLPEQTAFISEIMQNYFVFVLNNSVCDVKQHLILLKEEMKTWLRLRLDENVFVQVTNKNGSTTENLVTVRASVLSDTGLILLPRLQQLAQRITKATPSTNLGLNNTVFGKVKEIRLSSCLNRILQSAPPVISPAPAPAPGKNDDFPPIYPSAPSPTDLSPHSESTISPSPSPSISISVTAPSPSFLGVSPSSMPLPLISPSSLSSARGVFFDRSTVCFYGLLTLCLLL